MIVASRSSESTYFLSSSLADSRSRIWFSTLASFCFLLCLDRLHARLFLIRRSRYFVWTEWAPRGFFRFISSYSFTTESHDFLFPTLWCRSLDNNSITTSDSTSLVSSLRKQQWNKQWIWFCWVYGRVVNGSSSKPKGLSSSPETIDFLNNISPNAFVSLFTKQYKLIPAAYI